MTRFVDIDLAALPPPDAVQVPDYEALLAARKAELLARVAARTDDAALVEDLRAVLYGSELEPLVVDAEIGAEREVLVYQRINDAVRAVLLPTARGADLDNLVSRLGVVRMTIIPASGDAPAVMESDEDLRERYQLALEALSTAGPYGAYHFHARTAHPHVKRTGVYGPESGLVTPGQVRVVVLSRIGNGGPTGQVLEAVRAALDPEVQEDRVPLTDQVSVVGATIVPYAVSYHLKIARGPDPALVAAAAKAALEAYAEGRHKVGARVLTTALDGAAHGDRVNVEEVLRLAPLGHVDPGLQGAAWCTSVTVTWEVVDA